jgi:hypothetical protein
VLPTAANLSAALSTAADELEAAPELEELEELEELVELAELVELVEPDEPDEPDEPELEEVDADDEAVDELDSPALSVDVCDAVSQAATKKATAASAIRRCNMVMLPVFNPGLLAIRLSGGCPMNSPVLNTVAPFMSINRSLEGIRRWPYENKPSGSGNARAHKSRHLLAQISDN